MTSCAGEVGVRMPRPARAAEPREGAGDGGGEGGPDDGGLALRAVGGTCGGWQSDYVICT